MDRTYDAIVLGAGHNGLILATYLARAGLSVACVERRETAGGGLARLEDPRHPGLWHNTHAFFLRAITNMPWYRDLDLEAGRESRRGGGAEQEDEPTHRRPP